MVAHVSVSDLNVVFRHQTGEDIPAVRGAELNLKRGETLGIVGESGSGKSTLARALLGHVRPGARITRGHITVAGQPVLTLDARQLRSYRARTVAMVPQNPLSALTPHMTVGRQLQELVNVQRHRTGVEARAQVLALMDQTGLPDPATLAKRYPHELSGGQRQRVAIAAALVSNPELLILDEPTTALDKTVEARVLRLITTIQRRLNATLIYVSHDLNVIRRLCSKTAVMHQGRIIELTQTDTVFTAPRQRYTHSLIKAIPHLGVPGPPPAGNTQTPHLVLRDVTFSYTRPGRLLWRARKAPEHPTLSNLSFQVGKGETLGVVGESGSGKSTLAMLIAGAVSGYCGEIQLGDHAIAGPAQSRSRDLRQKVQLVFQDPLSALNPKQTIETIITRPLRLHFAQTRSAARDNAVRALEEMELSAEYLARFPCQLSGGQQQRIGFARALAAEPELLICDEVTSALDVTIQHHILNLFRRVQVARSMTCLFISHDLAVIAKVSHKIALLDQGRLIEIGNRDAVLSAPQQAKTRALLSATASHTLRSGSVKPERIAPRPTSAVVGNGQATPAPTKRGESQFPLG